MVISEKPWHWLEVLEVMTHTRIHYFSVHIEHVLALAKNNTVCSGLHIKHKLHITNIFLILYHRGMQYIVTPTEIANTTQNIFVLYLVSTVYSSVHIHLIKAIRIHGAFTVLLCYCICMVNYRDLSSLQLHFKVKLIILLLCARLYILAQYVY